MTTFGETFSSTASLSAAKPHRGGARAKRLDLNDLRLLLQVIEWGSLSAAAVASGIPVSTISQRISALEAGIGTGLLRRTTRSLSLTEEGSLLMPQAKAINEAARQAEAMLANRQAELQGTLRISCSDAISQSALAPLIPRFLRQHSKVSIRSEVASPAADLTGGGFDLCIRAHHKKLRDSSLRMRVVARTAWVLVASPEFLSEHGTPQRLADLPGAAVLYFAMSSEEPSWTFRKDGCVTEVRLAPRFTSDDMGTLLRTAIGGGGVIALPAYIAKEEVASGKLREVLQGWNILASTISILSPPRNQTSRLAASFSEFVAGELSDAVDA